MRKWAYEMSDEELLNEFTEAAIRAGVAGSGLVFDFGGGEYRRRALFLQGAIMARIKQESPPKGLRPGAKVRRKSELPYVVSTNFHASACYRYHLKRAAPIEIKQLCYRDNPNVRVITGKIGWGWELQLRIEDNDWFFLAEDFELVPDEATESA